MVPVREGTRLDFRHDWVTPRPFWTTRESYDERALPRDENASPILQLIAP
jgi:hypothetical protein